MARIVTAVALAGMLPSGLTPASAIDGGAAVRPAPAHSTAREQDRGTNRLGGVGAFYAINDTTRHVVRVDERRGRWTVTRVGPTDLDPRDLAVTRQGVLWVSSGDRLSRVDRAGRRRVIQLPRVSEIDQLTVDQRGNAYLTTGNGRVVRVTASGRNARVLGRISGLAPQTGPAGLGVDGAGRVTVAYEGSDWEDPDFGTYNVRLATFGPQGVRPTVRKIKELSDGSILQLSEATDGTVALRIQWVGGSGIVSPARYAPGSTVRVPLGTKIADNALTFDPAGRLYLMENRTFCPLPSRGANECDPPNDPAVDRALIYPIGGGTPRSIPIRALDIPIRGIAVDAKGRILASLPFAGPWNGRDELGQLLVVPNRSGGRAQPVIRGEFRELQVPR